MIKLKTLIEYFDSGTTTGIGHRPPSMGIPHTVDKTDVDIYSDKRTTHGLVVLPRHLVTSRMDDMMAYWIAFFHYKKDFIPSNYRYPIFLNKELIGVVQYNRPTDTNIKASLIGKIKVFYGIPNETDLQNIKNRLNTKNKNPEIWQKKWDNVMKKYNDGMPFAFRREILPLGKNNEPLIKKGEVFELSRFWLMDADKRAVVTNYKRDKKMDKSKKGVPATQFVNPETGEPEFHSDQIASNAILLANKILVKEKPETKIIVTYADSIESEDKKSHSGAIYKESDAIDHGFADKGDKHRFVYPMFKPISEDNKKLMELLENYVQRKKEEMAEEKRQKELIKTEKEKVKQALRMEKEKQKQLLKAKKFNK